MIVPKLELEQLLKGELGEVVRNVPSEVGDVYWVRETLRVEPVCRASVVDVWPVAGGWAVLLERVDETFVLPERVPPEKPRLRLTRTQRAKLFDRECPHIGGTGQCPVKAGEDVQLSSRVTLTVLRVDVQRGGKWKLMYELKDTRDAPRLLRRTPPAHREGGPYEHPTAAAIRDAAEQSGYTSSLAAAVSDAGEAPPRVWLDVRAKTISEFDHQRRLARLAAELREKEYARAKARSRARRKRAA